MRIDPRRSRERMVREQLEAKGVSDPRVLAAMRKVPRHEFLEDALYAQAYADHPVPIGYGQTISQPYIVALMSQCLEVQPGMRVLEIGTGSGYQAAVLAEMGAEVFSVERIPELHEQAKVRLQHYPHVYLKLDDGTMGWPEMAPFDRIMVTAGGPEVPEPLVLQMGDPSMMLIPVGKDRRSQKLVAAWKKQGEIVMKSGLSVSFVDLVGQHGW